MEIIQNHKYNLVVCEIFNMYIHGFDKNSYDCVKGHYLCMHVSRNRTIFDERDYSDDEDEEDDEEDEEEEEEEECHVNDIVDLHGAYYVNYVSKPTKKHDIIRNYRKIISKNDYIQPHIAEVIYLPSGECVAIIKTVWLKLVQRAWKRVFQQRKLVFRKRLQINSLHFRELYGKWPSDCNYYPSIYGMLNKLI